jgi:hypothetical protein
MFQRMIRLLPRRFQRAVYQHYLEAKGCTYCRDGLATFHSSAFLADPRFVEAHRLGKATGSWGSADVEWRLYILCWAACRAAQLQGDFVECGVNKGGYSRAVMHYVGFQGLKPRKFYLVDTFSGIPETLRGVAARNQLRRYGECYQEVVDTFRDFDNVVLVRGEVPAVLPQVAADQIAYLALDMNCAEPEIAAAEFFWDRLVSGAAVVLDDYGYDYHYRRQQHAFDEFARKRNVPLLLLPTGQGLLLKP